MKKFNIDIEKFISEGDISNKRSYYLFGHEGEIINITDRVIK